MSSPTDTPSGPPTTIMGKPPLPYRQSSDPSNHRSRLSSDAGSTVTYGGHSKESEQQQQQQQQHERAELGLVSSLENRRNHVKTSSGDVWYSSVEGERPPLHSVPFVKLSNAVESQGSNASDTHSLGSQDGGAGGGGSSTSTRSLRGLARRVMEINKTKSVGSGDSCSAGGGGGGPISKKHGRAASRAHQFLDMIRESVNEEDKVREGAADEDTKEDDQQQHQTGIFDTVGGEAHPEKGQSLFSAEGTNTDRLFSGAYAVDELFQAHEKSLEAEEFVEGEVETSASHYRDHDEDGETLPLKSNDDDFSDIYGSSSNIGSFGSKRRLARKKKKSWCQRMHEQLARLLDPRHFVRFMLGSLRRSYFLLASIPIFFWSWVLYFGLNNPYVDFLPGHASLAWWVNFIGRLCLTLELARLIQWIVIDQIILGTRTAARFLGPLVTLYVIQGSGWPFVVTIWSVVNLFLLHGSHHFQKHWLLFLTFGFHNRDSSNPVTGTPDMETYYNFLASGEYLRFLLAMIVAGTVTSAKRTAVAMHFGRRTFTEFKPRLEKLLKEVVLISEVSELALEIVEQSFENEDKMTVDIEVPANRKVKFLGDISWSSDPRLGRHARSKSTMESDDESEATEREAKDERGCMQPGEDMRSSSMNLPFKDLLDYWEEPVNKMDRSMNASIQDILKFRRALTFMDEKYPFGNAFGPASNRDEVLASAFNVYQRIVSSSENALLSCDILYLLAEDDDGVTIDRNKKRAIRKLFRPDGKNEVSGMSFVQACDSLYRSMRFFRASVGNASVIDHALESIVDGFYSFILGLVILSILQFNPWSLLVSISTLLVSVSFAVGPSAAKYIEGILLIAIRRPYDLGDRIYMHDPSVVNCNGLDYSWFVEDINLFNTTVRYAGTNEVATLSNGSMAHMRIVNGNRSPNAMVWFQLPFNHCVMEEEKMTSLKAFLEGFAKLYPHKWHSCSYCRADEFHPDVEKVIITIGFQSRSSWQALSGIYFAKSDLMAATIQYGRNQGIIYEELPQRQFHYKAGVLEQGGVWKHRAQLHQASNIMSYGDGNKKSGIVDGGGSSGEISPWNGPASMTRNKGRMEKDANVSQAPSSHSLSPDSLFLNRLKKSHD